MNIVEISIASSHPHFVQENDIFKKNFFLEFEWIEREGFWILHVADSADKPLACGLRLMPNWPLYKHHDRTHSFVLVLQAKVSETAINLNSLSRDFNLVACEAI
jgi:hypothetical protein